jgi:hypothetical protein
LNGIAISVNIVAKVMGNGHMAHIKTFRAKWYFDHSSIIIQAEKAPITAVRLATLEAY